MIGIFDSGIGGATIFKEIIKRLPNYHYIYYSDSKNNPYGDHTKEEIYLISSNITEKLIKKGCKIIVIACNTATTQSIDKLRKIYPKITFIGTEPACKMIHDHARKDKALIMATKGTIESERFLSLYHKYNNNKTILLPCIGLAELVEEGNQTKINEYLEKHLNKYKGVNDVVLGCTHYPLIKKNIEQILGNVKFFEGSIGISKELERKIKITGIKETKQIIEFFDSNNEKRKEKRFFEIINS